MGDRFGSGAAEIESAQTEDDEMIQCARCFEVRWDVDTSGLCAECRAMPVHVVTYPAIQIQDENRDVSG